MNDAINKLEAQFARIGKLDHASTFLSWDQMVMMPEAGMAARSESLAELASMRHELLTAPAMEDWLNEANDAIRAGDLPVNQRSHLREMHRSWQQASALPATLVRAQVMAGSKCEHGWRVQKGENDWTGFLNNFREVVALSREEAQCRQSHAGGRFDTPYDAMLDLHCTGDSQALIGSVFSDLKSALPSLLQRVRDKQASEPVKDLSDRYPIAQQKQLSEHLMSMLGFDFKAGRLDVSLHPFSTGAQGDQRITTRYRETDFADALQATAHETGHASYEAGLPKNRPYMPLSRARNMCIHESQSLMFEKQLFLSRAFSKALLEPLHEYLAATTSFSSDDIWMAQTRVTPSYIRVEADEVTYPLHVMLRYDIESALINGDIEANAIPEVWEEAMQSYLGLSVKGDHQKGCLQDIHWTDGAFGYFPSYTMGAVNAAQLSASMKLAHPDWQAQLSRGELSFAREWLSENIWQHGCEFESQTLMEKATGEGSCAKYLLAHLENRYIAEID